MQLLLLVKLLVLLSTANGAPVLAKKVCGDRFARPIDAGFNFFDGRPLFGPSKTIRGVVVSVGATTAAAPFLGLGIMIGAFVGSAAMAGDLFSSFVKRRINFLASSRATGLDQIPESFFPLLACRYCISLTMLDIFIIVTVFLIGAIFLSQIFYRLGVRDRPY